MTYKQQLDNIVRNARNDQSNIVIANMMATSLMMQWEGGNAQCDQNAIYDTAHKLMHQKGFRELMKDPLAVTLAKQGRHLDLVQLMDVKENEIRRAKEA